MLLDVLVLGHLFSFAAAAWASRRALSAVALQQPALTDSRRALVTFADARVCDRCGDFLSALYVYETTRGT